MEKKNNEILRVVVMSDSRTNEMKLIDETIIKPRKPTKIVIDNTKEGQKIIKTNKITKL